MTVMNPDLSRQDRPAADRLRIAGLTADDLPEADRIMRLAFGTFLGLPDPLGFGGDSAYVAPRWRAAPESAFGAWRDGRLVGSIFAARWGSFGLFGFAFLLFIKLFPVIAIAEVKELEIHDKAHGGAH